MRNLGLLSLSLMCAALSTVSALASTSTSVVERYPGLKKFLAEESPSYLYFGFGVSPLTIVNSKIGFSASLFQLHWIRKSWDIEIFNGSFSSVFGQQYGNEQMFLLRTAPKYKIFKNISIGPMLGVEFVHFPDVTEKLNKGTLYSTKPFEFSTTGLVYGASLSETFSVGGAESHHLLKVNETLYKENYSTTGTQDGWDYYFIQDSVRADNSPIKAGTVFLLEVSYLY